MPETPIAEDWLWSTNIQTSNNGREVRVCLRDEPKRTQSLKYTFTEERDLQAVRNVMYGESDRPFLIPWYQNGTTLTAAAKKGALALALNNAKAELRAGCAAILYDRKGNRETITVDSLLPGGVSLVSALGRDWSVGASIAPAWPVSAGNMTFTRNHLGGATSGITVTDLAFMVPFLNPLNAEVLPMFAGLPVVPYGPLGSTFDEGFVNGSNVVDYGGVAYMRSPWKFQKMTFPRTFMSNRFFDRPNWLFWNKFADYCKGSQNPFYMPTYREDFAVVAPPQPNGNTFTLKGTEYAEEFFPNAAFKQFAFFTRAGVHYASVTACAIEGGNTKCTFAPALPNVAGYAVDQLISLLLKLRIADDKISCEHTSLQTRLTINLRTVEA